ncbi:hypothetical protein GYMLUDRAFT_43639 [Collybiopsis luxurians FD-317 M1]|uniref:60S acidic ribosomal protein P2 n=1 Tax=Collybiopsis luxurians FD-317 M1 TaxID=944289 RepID=A0A0D0BXB3_9AGAR|nr:hypothetical protein GYMLUDRAFT_43639 [Collybiopsis luxurians FD-317 M1]
MRYIAAYLLLQMGGNPSPSASDIKRVLSAVSIQADDERLDKLLSALKDKDINQLIQEGSSKLSLIPSGGGPVPVDAGGGGTQEKEVDKKEENEELAKDDGDDSEDEGFYLNLFD